MQCGSAESCIRSGSTSCYECTRSKKDYFLDVSTFDKSKTSLYIALDFAEKFMEESGIRKFCSEVCGGKCCASCSRPPGKGLRCYEGGERNLACSSFICHTLRDFFTVCKIEQHKDFFHISNVGEFYKTYENYHYASWECKISCAGNPEKISKAFKNLNAKSMADIHGFIEKFNKQQAELREISMIKRKISDLKYEAKKAQERLKSLQKA